MPAEKVDESGIENDIIQRDGVYLKPIARIEENREEIKHGLVGDGSADGTKPWRKKQPKGELEPKREEQYKHAIL